MAFSTFFFALLDWEPSSHGRVWEHLESYSDIIVVSGTYCMTVMQTNKQTKIIEDEFHGVFFLHLNVLIVLLVLHLDVLWYAWSLLGANVGWNQHFGSYEAAVSFGFGRFWSVLKKWVCRRTIVLPPYTLLRPIGNIYYLCKTNKTWLSLWHLIAITRAKNIK